VNRAVDRTGRWISIVLGLIALGGYAVAAVAWSAGKSVPGWVPFALGAPLVALVIVAYFLGKRSGGPTASADQTQRIADLERQVADAEYGKRLLYDALESIQQAVASDEEWNLNELVERGVLGPVRGLLTRRRHEDVRLSVLMPRSDGKFWWMRWAAGHRPESVRSYRREIDLTMAGIAFRRADFIAPTTSARTTGSRLTRGSLDHSRRSSRCLSA
jgi:hypothetical protein